MARWSAGEQPLLAGSPGGALTGVCVVEESEDQLVQRRGQVQGDGAQQQLDPCLVLDDLLGGEADDAAQGLAVGQHEQASHSVPEVRAVVMDWWTDLHKPDLPSSGGSFRNQRQTGPLHEGPRLDRCYRGSRGLARGRSHSDAWVGATVVSTTPSSSALSASRSTCSRSRAANASTTRAAS